MSALSPYETLLGLLAVRSQHGYELLQRFQDIDELGRIWKLSPSQLYAMLKRLERDGMVLGQQAETSGGPPRTEYLLTEEGVIHLNAWLHTAAPSPSIRHVRLEFLSRLYIACELGRPVEPIRRAQIFACEAELARLKTERAAVYAGIQALALDLVIAQMQAAVDWLNSPHIYALGLVDAVSDTFPDLSI